MALKSTLPLSLSLLNFMNEKNFLLMSLTLKSIFGLLSLCVSFTELASWGHTFHRSKHNIHMKNVSLTVSLQIVFRFLTPKKQPPPTSLVRIPTIII